MYLKLGELRGKRADRGLPSSMEAVAEGTGIDQRTLEKIAAKDIKLYRREYIDALCAFFGCTPSDLIANEPIDLPLKLEIRPDRHGVRVGKRTARHG